MVKLTPQELKVYDYIKDHPGCTTHDITRDTFIQKPCARIADLRRKGVGIESVGQEKYPGTRAFEKYAITKQLTKRVQRTKLTPEGTMRVWYEEVPI